MSTLERCDERNVKQRAIQQERDHINRMRSGEMETNGQQETARSRGSLVQADDKLL